MTDNSTFIVRRANVSVMYCSLISLSLAADSALSRICYIGNGNLPGQISDRNKHQICKCGNL